MEKTFFGRKTEISNLRKLRESPEPKIAVLYGRRRIGKSTLIKTAYQSETVLYFEGLEGQSKQLQISNFLLQLQKQLPESSSLSKPIKTWSEAFLELAHHTKNGMVIVFDELQWMANYRSELISHLKMVWEQHLSQKKQVTLVLCGSIASYMITNVVRSKALYGRSMLTLHVRPFELHETAQMLHSKGEKEILLAQLLTGGVPLYLKLMQEHPSMILGMQSLGFQPNGFFVEEYQRIFISHFGKNSNYEKIIKILAKKPYGLTRKALAAQIKTSLGGQLSEALDNLESADFITSQRPYDKSNDTKIIRYVLTDAYFRFYFEFIHPNLNKIDQGQKNIFVKISQAAKWYSWLGRAFEYTCMQHQNKISTLLGFGDVDYIAGPYFRAKTMHQGGVQVDLLFDRADHVISLCEMKYSDSPLGKDLIAQVQKKVELLPNPRNKTVQKILITNSKPTHELIREGYFYKILTSDQLLL